MPSTSPSPEHETEPPTKTVDGKKKDGFSPPTSWGMSSFLLASSHSVEMKRKTSSLV